MSDIFQQIWTEDLKGRGVPAIGETAEAPEAGHVRVDETGGGPDHSVMTEVEIPTSKRETYDLCRKLFDNYILNQFEEETDLLEEEREIDALLEACIASDVMRLARDYIQTGLGQTMTDKGWYAKIKTIWFMQANFGDRRDVSGFEHVFVGEAKGDKLGGYHFWYKYWLDDTMGAFNRDDLIDYGGPQYRGVAGAALPDVVTISYHVAAPDYASGQLKRLSKPIGGFWVGPSTEAMLAMGTVAFINPTGRDRAARIGRGTYEVKIYKNDADRRMLRTFFPILKAVDGAGEMPGTVITYPGAAEGAARVRIVAALINPPGHDPGQETVTLINTTDGPLALTGWKLVDRNGNSHTLEEGELAGGAARAIVLPPNTCQLSNKGGSITLLDGSGRTVHKVAYTKSDARGEGRTVVF